LGAASTDFVEALKRLRKHKGTGVYPALLAALVEVWRVRGQMQRAPRLADAAAALVGGTRSYPANTRLNYDCIVEEAHARLGDPVLATAWAGAGDDTGPGGGVRAARRGSGGR
jgi:hypothetical protein